LWAGINFRNIEHVTHFLWSKDHKVESEGIRRKLHVSPQKEKKSYAHYIDKNVITLGFSFVVYYSSHD
jgi:hypothetical protein